MKHHKVLYLFIALLVAAATYAQPKTGAAIVPTSEGGFTLYVDGVRTYIKGVGGTNRIDLAAQNGANAFRTWGGDIESIARDMELAARHNMFVMQGISLPKDSNAYIDETFKANMRTTVTALAQRFKDSPNLLIWGLGNEIELHGKNNTAASWGFVDELARIIKTIDKRHLVATVITHNPQALDSIAKYAPNLDLIGINSYGAISQAEQVVAQSAYKGAYMITEWGPTGWWETNETTWGAPLEQTSEEKRIVYETRYNDYIYAAKRCLGSFVFLWGQKEERTPTWFSMFVENNVDGLPLQGEKTPMVEAMERVWTRTEPARTAPVIAALTLDGRKPTDSPTVKAGQPFRASVAVADKEGDTLHYVWEILKEATILGSGGSYEPRPERYGSVETNATNSLESAVDQPGNYRLYVYVLDGTGFVATANIPFQVIAEQ